MEQPNRLPHAPWLFRALLASIATTGVLLAVDCAPSAPAEPCTDFPPRCEGNMVAVCNDGGIARVDCAADGGLSCLKNKKGEGTCAKPCPATLDQYGACQGDHLQICDGKILQDSDCAEQGLSCGYMIEGYATCTKACPSFVDGFGACNGPGLRRCNGQVFFDLNCFDQQKLCATTADGTVQCTATCPPGLDSFGVCDGAIAKRCDGAVYKEEDCAKAGKMCVELDRNSVGCRGCATTTPTGVCSATSEITTCTASGKELHESCIARGGTCGWSDTECRNTCLEPKPVGTCAAAKLAEGQQQCHQNPFTHFWSIQTCKDGLVAETECPAASDGSVSCAAVGGVPTCHTTCGLYGRRCTDRGVLVACTSAGLAWMDCSELGAKCVDDGKDARCACTTVPDAAARCTTDKHAWEPGLADAGLEEGGTGFVIDAGDGGAEIGLQYTCSGGRVDVAPCTCTKP